MDKNILRSSWGQKLLHYTQWFAGCDNLDEKKLKITFEDTSYPARLHLSLGHNGSKGMDETHHSQCGVLQGGWENVLVKAYTVPSLVHCILGQEGEIIVVPRSEHDDIHLWTDAEIRADVDLAWL